MPSASCLGYPAVAACGRRGEHGVGRHCEALERRSNLVCICGKSLDRFACARDDDSDVYRRFDPRRLPGALPEERLGRPKLGTGLARIDRLDDLAGHGQGKTRLNLFE